MSAGTRPGPSRRSILAGAGCLVVGFRIGGAQAQEAGMPTVVAPDLPGSLKHTPGIDAWIRIDADGSVTVRTGKAELGQGVKTALIQVAAEELDLDPRAIRLVTADTGETPNEGYTAGSHSMQHSGTAIRRAAAQVRAILVAQAASRWALPPADLIVRDRAVVASDGRTLGFGELAATVSLARPADANVQPKPPERHKLVGTSLPRVDLPAKVTGGEAFIQDIRLPGMVHARVMRPPSYHAELTGLDTGAVEGLPGVLKVVRDGNFLAVVAAREFQAVSAMTALCHAATWRETPSLPAQENLFEALAALPAEEHVIHETDAPRSAATQRLQAVYRRAYQMHGSIGPSCAIARAQDGAMTVWTHSQGVFPLRSALAELLQMEPGRIRCIHAEGSGCYGHNAADDVAADAALIARVMPGRPVRVQLMREQEHLWEPYGPAMIAKVDAALDAEGSIVDWRYEVRSNTHLTRPPGAGNLLAARHLASPFPEPAPRRLPQPDGGGDRNAIPLYAFPKARVLNRFVPAMPLRVSALRSLGAYLNVFAIEGAMDELAALAGADPVAFRLAHLQDPRARAVVEKAAAAFAWSARPRGGPRWGSGFAFARYKNSAAYAAVAVEVEVVRESGRLRLTRAVAAVDAGEAVNPDGIRNQIEGGILQSASWTLYEQVTFDETRITSRDWSTYPILRFPALPKILDVHIIDRKGEPFLGTGEASQGPTAAAIANAVADATGIRCRDIPITADRIRSAVL